MRAPTTITRLVIEPLDIPMQRPFGIAGGVQRVAENALVIVELGDGTLGFGEAAPFAAFNGETRAAAVAAAEAARSVVEGDDARAWRRIAAALAGPAGASGAARCAIETAVLDALARRAGMPLWAFFGGATRALVSDVTIPTGSVAQAATEASEWAREGFSRLKIKVGGARAAGPLADARGSGPLADARGSEVGARAAAGSDPSDDVGRVVAIREAASDAALMLDGNGGFSAEGALDLLADLRARGVVPILFEQPVPGADLDGLARVAKHGGVPVAADESVSSAADVLRVAAAGAATVVNIKPMKSGVAEALAIAETARAAGLGLMIGGMVEAKIAMSLSACLAAGLGGFAFVDLDTPLFLAGQPFEGGYAQRGEHLDLSPIEAGHGARPVGR